MKAVIWWAGGLPAILCPFTQLFQTQYKHFSHGKFLWLHESSWENISESWIEAGGEYNWQLILRNHRKPYALEKPERNTELLLKNKI